jgi:hypothetical protein
MARDSRAGLLEIVFFGQVAHWDGLTGPWMGPKTEPHGFLQNDPK